MKTETNELSLTIGTRTDLSRNLPQHLVVFSFALSIASISFLRILPSSSGWFSVWAHALTQRSMYDDMYMPLTPLCVLLSKLMLLVAPNPILGEQVLAIAIWCMLALALSLVMKNLYDSRTSLIATIVSLSFYSAQPFKIISGYFEFSLALLFLGVWQLTRHNKTSHNAFLSGLFFGLSILAKQTFLVPVLIVCVYEFLFSREHLKSKNSQLSRTALVLGLVSSATPFLVWLAVDGNLGVAIHQISGGGGKGLTVFDLPERLINWGLLEPVGQISLFTLALLVSGFVLFRISDFDQSRILVSYSLISLGVFSAFQDSVSTTGSEKNTLIIFAALWFCIGLGEPPLISPAARSDLPPSRMIPLIFGIVLLLRNLEYLYDSKLRENLVNLLEVASILYLLGNLQYVKRPDRWSSNSHRVDSHPKLNQNRLVVLLVSVGVVVMNALSGAVTIESLLIPLGLLIASAFKTISDPERVTQTHRYIATLGLIAVIPMNGLGLMDRPYEWWGLREESQLDSQRGKTDIENLEVFSLSSSSALYYQQLNDVFRRVDPDGNFRYFFGVQNQGLSLTFDRQSIELRCQITWWDTCPDAEIGNTLKELQASRPEVIVWNNPPEWVQRAHEEAFNGGELSQLREFSKWIDSAIEQGRYQVVATIDVPNSDGWSTSVILRID